MQRSDTSQELADALLRVGDRVRDELGSAGAAATILTSDLMALEPEERTLDGRCGAYEALGRAVAWREALDIVTSEIDSVTAQWRSEEEEEEEDDGRPEV